MNIRNRAGVHGGAAGPSLWRLCLRIVTLWRLCLRIVTLWRLCLRIVTLWRLVGQRFCCPHQFFGWLGGGFVSIQSMVWEIKSGHRVMCIVMASSRWNCLQAKDQQMGCFKEG
ncbi:unnamed protein product [Prunus brigantina]